MRQSNELEKDGSSIQSALSSLAGSAAEEAGRAIGAARFESMRLALARAAEKKTVISGGVIGGDAVESPLIRNMIYAYNVASKGRVIVVCAPADSGKTHAAEFLMHGKHPSRPARSLKIDATSMDDFATQFSFSQFGVKDAAPHLPKILCSALKSTPESKGVLSNIVGWVSCSSSQEGHTFVESKAISLYGPNKVLNRVPVGDPFPLLIIDGLNEDTEENEDFMKRLLNVAAEEGVFVFVMTTNRDWATKMVDLNGGSKIKPLDNNVDNPGYSSLKRFVGTPQWNNMPWPVDMLRELIRPFCEKHGLDPSNIVPDDASLNPVEAMDQAKAVLFAPGDA